MITLRSRLIDWLIFLVFFFHCMMYFCWGYFRSTLDRVERFFRWVPEFVYEKQAVLPLRGKKWDCWSCLGTFNGPFSASWTHGIARRCGRSAGVSRTSWTIRRFGSVRLSGSPPFGASANQCGISYCTEISGTLRCGPQRTSRMTRPTVIIWWVPHSQVLHCVNNDQTAEQKDVFRLITKAL